MKEISPHLSCGAFEITPHVEKLQIYPHLLCGEMCKYSTCSEISDISISVMYRNLKFLHMSDFFFTGTAPGARDKYEVCAKVHNALVEKNFTKFAICDFCNAPFSSWYAI